MDNFRLLQADLESEVLNSLCKAGYNELQGCLRMGKKGSIVSDELLPCFDVSLEYESPQVEQAAACAVSNVDAVFIVKVSLIYILFTFSYLPYTF